MLAVVLLLCFFSISSLMAALLVVFKPKDAPSTLDPVPSWADPVSLRPTERERTKKLTADLNAAGTRVDFVLYGDSITAFHLNDPSVLKKYWGSNAVALGVPSDTFENLAHRLMSGDEKLAKDPKCIAIMIGINNILLGKGNPTERMPDFLQWLKKVHPTSKIVLLALLPTARPAAQGKVAPANASYKQTAASLGVQYVECGLNLSTSGPLMPDGLHPSREGHDVIHSCLRRAISL